MTTKLFLPFAMVALVCSLLFPCAARAAESGEFAINTGGGVFSGSAASTADFAINTRGGAAGYANSAYLTIDTRDGSSLSVSVETVDGLGANLAGVTVTARQNGFTVSTATTAANGAATLAGLLPGYYELRAEKAGLLPQVRRHVRVPEDVTGGVTFTLPAPRPAPMVSTTTIAPVTSLANPPRPASTSQLRVFTGGVTGTWSTTATVDPTKMTIMMTHGCESDADEWALPMARKLAGIPGLTSKVNLLAWDWWDGANVPLLNTVGVGLTLGLACVVPRQNTPEQGLWLGQALRTTLGANYARPIHFLGHSLGTLVNGAAIDYLHGDDPRHFVFPTWLPERTQATLFDHAALLPDVRLSYSPLGFISPVPQRAAYVESYLTAVGFPSEKALNVYLQRVGFSHSAPMDWYASTIDRPEDCLLGFRQSFAYAELRSRSPDFPVPTTYEQGTLFRQAFPPADELSLVWLGKPDGLKDNIPIKIAELELAALIGGGNFGNAVTDTYLWSLNRGVQGSEYVVDAVSTAGAAVGRKLGEVTVEVVGTVRDGVGALVNLLDSVDGAGQTTSAVLDIPGYAQDTQARSAFSLRVDLQTRPAVGGITPQGLRTADVTATNSPAYVWLPVSVPSNALTMTFDFQVSGDGASDRVVAGLGATNLFNLKTEFLPTNMWVNSGPLPVSAWAGQEAELFLGLAGGTSTNACLSVQNIRFVSVPQPMLENYQIAGRTVLTWAEAVPGLQLEFSTNAYAAIWTAMTNTTAYTGQRVFTNEATTARGFYRLRRP